MIAIKEITKDDEIEFNNFLSRPRYELPKLALAKLPYPHNSILIIKNRIVDKSAHDYIISKCKNRTDIDDSTVVYSDDPLRYGCDNDGIFYFSGYLINKNKLYFGFAEIQNSGIPLDKLYECYGEYILARFKNGTIELTSDYFGMSPWFYYTNDNIFIASNHYHLLLESISRLKIPLSMDIDHSSVNLITSGFMYGSAFSKELDVKHCYVNLPYEKIIIDKNSVTVQSTGLLKDLTVPEDWDELKYEEYLRKSKEEIIDNMYAYCSHPNFHEVVLDVSGGFDSRITFAAANCMPKAFRKKFKIHTRRSGTKDDIEKASMVTNVYNYKKVAYGSNDNEEIFVDGEVNLCQISRTLGFYSQNTALYLSNYSNRNRIQITGYLGEVTLGYKRVRGELQYSLGDQKLLARLGGSYLWNSVKQLEPVYSAQKRIINEVLNICPYNELFKKFHVFYTLFRNRFICGSSHNIEYDNIRVSPLHSKYALKAKWMYFNKFGSNSIPDEKLSLDLLSLINPIMVKIPFASENDDVISNSNNLLFDMNFDIIVNPTIKKIDEFLSSLQVTECYKDKVKKQLQDLDIVKQMILYIYDYSNDYHNVCLGLYRIVREFENQTDVMNSSHALEQIRKIYDVYYQMRCCVMSRS